MNSIKSKLSLGFGLLLVFLCFQAVTTFVVLGESEALVSNVVVREFHTGLETERMAIEGQKLRRYEKEYFIYIDNPSKRQAYAGEWNEAMERLLEQIDEIVENDHGIWSESVINKASMWAGHAAAYRTGFQHILDRVESGDLTTTLEANEAITEAKTRFGRFLTAVEAEADERYLAAETAASDINKNFRLLKQVLAITAAAGILLALALIIIVPRLISRPIGALVKSAEVMSTGNLNDPVVETKVTEFRQLAETLDRLRLSQKALIHHIKRNS